jgi:aspartyl protease family protein
MRRPAVRAALLGGVLLAGLAAGHAQTVTLAGSMGAGRALLLIDGQPRVLAVGESAGGVTLQRLADGEASVLVAGQPRLLRLGDTPARLAAAPSAMPADADSIVLAQGADGHFAALGSINGRSVRFLVDTGASVVAISRADAERIGLDWRRGKPGLSRTANGLVPVHGVVLDAVRLGGVELLNVAAVVVPADMPAVLLGNSFLSRFSMQRNGDVMRLQRQR